MDGINQFDLITQRVLALHAKNMEEELQRTLTALEVAQKRILELEAPPPVETSKDA